MSTSFSNKADFYGHLLEKQKDALEMPSNKEISGWVVGILDLLFPERQSGIYHSVEDIQNTFDRYTEKLENLLVHSKVCEQCDHGQVARRLMAAMPSLYRSMQTDAEAILQGDPAAKSYREVIRTYPGFFAIAIYRIAHELYQLNVPLIPRILTEYAHSKTGIDIHPGAVIGEYLAIDHGTGLVIGETTVIGNHVKLYQGVTLGALSVEKELANIKRHPTIEDNVIIYSNATILGGETVIGHDTVIGGNVWLTSSVAPNMTIYHQANTKVIDKQILS